MKKIHYPHTDISQSHPTSFAKCGRLVANGQMYNEKWDDEITCRQCLAVMRKEDARFLVRR